MGHKDGHNAAAAARDAFEQRMQEIARATGQEQISLQKDVEVTPFYIFNRLIGFDEDGFLLQLELSVTPATAGRIAYIIDGDMGIEYEILDAHGQWSSQPGFETIKFYDTVYSAVEPVLSEGLTISVTNIEADSANLTPPFEAHEFDADPAAAKTSVNITYGQEEYSRIRERFSAPEGSTFKSLIEETLSGIINELDLTIAGRVSGKKVLAPKQFTRNDFFAISGVEGAQDVAVSLSTVTGSAGVTSTSVYSAGSGY